MTNALSRLLVAAAGIPLVLGLVYLGGWWVFGLAAVAATIALHEFWLLARPLSPLAPAGYVGGLLALVGAELGGVTWMVGGVLTTLALAFLLKGISGARQTPTASISATLMGAVWIGFGLAFVILLRHTPDHGRLAAITLMVAVWGGDTFAYAGGRLLGRHKLAPMTSPSLRVAAQAGHEGEGHRSAPGRPRWRPRPDGRTALRGPCRVLLHPRVRVGRRFLV